jgi:hypothetical protein
MSNELIKPNDDVFDYAIQPVDQSSKDLDELSGSRYLPRIQLTDSNSKMCKEKGVRAGTYLFVRSNDSYDDLTNSFDCIIFARRAKAVRMSQAGIFSFFDPTNDEFKKIVDESEIRDSGCFFGPEYLLWIKANKAWATMLCGSKTARRSSTDINNILNKFDKSRRLNKIWGKLKAGQELFPDEVKFASEESLTAQSEEPVIFKPFATFKCSIKRKANYSWWGMDISPCSTPFGVSPPADEIATQVQKFLNPPKTDVETVQEDKPKRAR